MKIVRENISFEKGRKPVGRDSLEYKETVFKSLQERGIYFNFEWDKDNEQFPKFLENINDIVEYLELLYSVGVSYKDMRISHWDHVQVNTYQILASNHVIMNCLSERDAKFVIEIMGKFCTRRGDLSFEKDGSEHLHWAGDIWRKLNPDPENKYGDIKSFSEFEFVRNIEKNRKKYGV